MLSVDGQALCYTYNGERLRIEPWGKDSLRVRAVPSGEILQTQFALLSPDTGGEADVQIEEGLGEIRNGQIRATIRVNPKTHRGRIAFYDRKGTLLLEECGDGGALNRSARQFRPYPGGAYALQMTFAANPAERLFGMGQYQQEILDLKGCNLELAQRNSQASVPFYLSSLGYGFLWHNPAVGSVHFGKNTTEWQAACTTQLDYWITAGETPDEIERAYARVTGTVPMMPEYGLGFWQSKLRYWNQEQLLETAREYYRRKIPVDVIVCDFFHWPKLGDFRFDEAVFPDPAAMVRELKEMGMELMVSVWPEVALDSENYAEMRQKGLLLQAQSGVAYAKEFGGVSMFYDAMNPKAGSYVWEKCRQNYYDAGIRLFWLDEAEPNFLSPDPELYRSQAGSMQQIGNRYPQAFAANFYEGLRAAGETQIVSLIRCAWAGSQRYGALVWSGDIHSSWEDFRCQLCAGLHMGIAGIPWWTTDIGGFTGGNPREEEFRELLLRWFAWGTFCPVMRLHGDREGDGRGRPRYPDGREGLFTGGDNEIWSFGEENTPILEHFIRVREAMRPYTRALMREAHTLGRPVMRPMFYEFWQDPVCWELQDQYLFGDGLLVAPVMEPGVRERKVYLPQGAQWISLTEEKEVREGGQWIEVSAPLETIPVLVRKGWETRAGIRELFRLVIV